MVADGAAGASGGRPCALCTVDRLTEEALAAARSRLDPAAGAMVSAVWELVHRTAGVGRPPSGHRRCVMANCVGGHQYRVDPASRRATRAAAAGRGTSFPSWAELLSEYARHPDVVTQADVWRQVTSIPAALPSPQPLR